MHHQSGNMSRIRQSHVWRIALSTPLFKKSWVVDSSKGISFDDKFLNWRKDQKNIKK